MSYLELQPREDRMRLVRLSSGVVPPIYGRVGVGLGQAETPAITTLPWEIEKIPTRAETKEARMGKLVTWLGIIGGTLGVILSWREFRRRR